MGTPNIKAICTKMMQTIFQYFTGIFWVCQLSFIWYNVYCSQLMSWFDRYQLQLVYLTVEHHPVRNLQYETSQTNFDRFSQSQHLPHTPHTSFFVFQLHNEIVSFEDTWMDLDTVIEWSKSKRRKQILYNMVHMWNLEKW